MFQSFWTALIGFGFALLVGTIADLLFRRSDFKWYWNLLFGLLGLYGIGPFIVTVLNALGITLPLTLLGLPVAWIDFAWQLIFGIIGTFILLIILNAIFWKKDSGGNDTRDQVVSSRPGTDYDSTRHVDGLTGNDRPLDTDSRNRIVTNDPTREDTVTGNDFLEIRDNRDPDDRM